MVLIVYNVGVYWLWLFWLVYFGMVIVDILLLIVLGLLLEVFYEKLVEEVESVSNWLIEEV